MIWCTDVVGIFGTEASIVRMVKGMLLKQTAGGRFTIWLVSIQAV
jgi:hypothetical protein